MAGALHSGTFSRACRVSAAEDAAGTGLGGRVKSRAPGRAGAAAEAVRGSARRWARAAGQRRDGCGRRRGGGGPSLLLQGGAARGRLRGEDVAGAALLREQVQRQAHHHPAGADPGGAGLGTCARRSPLPLACHPAFPLPLPMALGTRGVRAACRCQDRPREGAGRGRTRKSPSVPGGGFAGRGVPVCGLVFPSAALPLGHQVFSLSGLECQPFFFPGEVGT